MNKSNVVGTVLSIISLGIAILAFVSEQYRVLIISLFTLFIATYFISIIYNQIDENSEKIKKLDEKIKIYEQLIDIKSDIKSLKKEVFKK